MDVEQIAREKGLDLRKTGGMDGEEIAKLAQDRGIFLDVN